MWTQGAGSVVVPSLLVGCFDGSDCALNKRSKEKFKWHFFLSEGKVIPVVAYNGLHMTAP